MPKTPVTAKVKPAGTSAQDLVLVVRALRRKVEESLDQMSLVQGVLEELCERQEALAAWQMEFAKRTISLGEAQWRALEGLSGQAAFAGLQAKSQVQSIRRAAEAAETSVPRESTDDSLNEASAFLVGLSDDLAKRREVRTRVHEERAGQRHAATAGEAESTGMTRRKGARSRKAGALEIAVEKPSTVEAPESILVLPEKTDFH